MKQHSLTNTSLSGLMLILLFSLKLPAQESIPWWKHWERQDNYVAAGGYGIGDPVVIYDEKKYKMWFCHQGPEWSIGYAESDDGITWTQGTIVIPPGDTADWDQHKGPGTVMRINDTLRMWYYGFQYSCYAASFGHAWSLDGITWNKRQTPVLERGPSCWDEWGISYPKVYHDGDSYHMWYSGRVFPSFSSPIAIGYATSPDGINWEKDLENSPVILTGPEGSFYDVRVLATQPVKYQDTLHMLFTGFNGDGFVPYCYHNNIGYAYSPDGLQWTVTGDTALPVGPPGAWDNVSVFLPNIMFHEGYFKMWYTGASFGLAIGYAEEPVHCYPNGITFTSQAEIDDFPGNNPECRVIKGDVIISGNDITNLNGLNVLTYINGSLKIQFNPLLTSLSGLENIDPASIHELWISNNPSLTFCAVKSICDYLVSPVGSITVFNNAPGCNNPEEIEETCSIITTIDGSESIAKFTVSPNPFSSRAHLQFTLTQKGLTTIDLYQASGIRHQQLLNEIKIPGNYEIQVDLSDLQPGIYLFRIISGEEIEVKKAVKL